MSWVDLFQTIAIVVSITLVIIQMRLYSKTVKASTYPNMMQRVDRVNEIMIEYPEVFASLSERYPDTSETKPDDRRPGLMWTILSFYDELYFQHMHGFIDKEVWHGWVEGNMKATLSLPYAMGFWKAFRDVAYYPEFRRFIDGLMSGFEIG